MDSSKCPHCGAKLGQYLYADACPHCHRELEHNTRPMVPMPEKVSGPVSWPVRVFRRLVRLIES